MANSNAIATAKYYVENLRLPIIPCNGKKPCISKWQTKAATTLEEINSWYQKYPSMNLGLVLGAASQIIGIDVDGDAAKEELQKWANGDLPETWTYSTPSGGLRLLYKAPSGLTLRKFVQKLPGNHAELALMGDGQQTIFPPSSIVGKPYKWLKDRSPNKQPLAAAPQWMIDRMTGTTSAIPVSKSKGAVTKSGEHFAIERLEKKCSAFSKAFKTQKASGLSEDEWHLWTRLFTSSKQPEAAVIFSEWSHKHDHRSDERIEKLIEQSSTNPAMVRCSSFGCSLEKIEKCHVKLNLNNDDEPTNSPGTFIRDASEGPTLPTEPIYKPYIEALSDIPDYTLNEKGHLMAFDKKDNPFNVANFVARPTLEVIYDDGEEAKRSYEIEGVLHGGKKLKPAVVEANQFTSMNWVMENWGISTSIKPGQGKKDIFRDAIQNMGQSIEKKYIYTHLGWRKLPSGQWVYLHADGCIGMENISIEIEKELSRYSLPAPSSIQDAQKAAKVSMQLLKVAPFHVVAPLLAIVYLAPLDDAFQRAGIEPNFVVWLHGTTGSRKTTLGQLFLSHFGNFASKTPPASFKDTANAIERKAFSTKDSLLLIDDFHPEASKSESNKMMALAQRVIRMFGDRVGRGRLTSTIQFQKTYAPRSMAIVTGEDIPKGESTVARFYEVELQKTDVNLDNLTKLQKRSSYLAQAMVGYIQWLAPQMDNLPDILLEKFGEKRNELLEKAAHARLAESAAWLLVAFEMMLSYMEDCAAVTETTAKKLLKKAEITMTRSIRQQSNLITQEKPEEIFLKALKTLFDTNQTFVTDISKGKELDTTLLGAGQRIGWFDDTFYYLQPEATYNAVSVLLSKRGEKLPVSERTLWKHLEQAGMIKVEKIEGGTRRCIKKAIPQSRSINKKKIDRPRLLHLYTHFIDDTEDDE